MSYQRILRCCDTWKSRPPSVGISDCPPLPVKRVYQKSSSLPLCRESSSARNRILTMATIVTALAGEGTDEDVYSSDSFMRWDARVVCGFPWDQEDEEGQKS